MSGAITGQTPHTGRFMSANETNIICAAAEAGMSLRTSDYDGELLYD